MGHGILWVTLLNKQLYLALHIVSLFVSLPAQGFLCTLVTTRLFFVRPAPLSHASALSHAVLFQHGSRMLALQTLSLFLSASLSGCLGLTLPAELPPRPRNLPPPLGFNSSDGTPSVDLPLALPVALRVFSVDYHHVQAPFEIVLWIMLASLAKLGKNQPSIRCYKSENQELEFVYDVYSLTRSFGWCSCTSAH